MVRVKGKILPNHGTELLHEPSGSVIKTTAPKDNGGDGSSFSPTDLLASSYGACMITIMSLKANARALDLTGTSFEVEKHMSVEGPRRVARLRVHISFPAGLDEETREWLISEAKKCPVALSVDPELKIELLVD